MTPDEKNLSFSFMVHVSKSSALEAEPERLKGLFAALQLKGEHLITEITSNLMCIEWTEDPIKFCWMDTVPSSVLKKAIDAFFGPETEVMHTYWIEK